MVPLILTETNKSLLDQSDSIQDERMQRREPVDTLDMVVNQRLFMAMTCLNIVQLTCLRQLLDIFLLGSLSEIIFSSINVTPPCEKASLLSALD